VGLAHVFLQRLRPHAVCQGAGVIHSLIGGVHSLHETLKTMKLGSYEERMIGVEGGILFFSYPLFLTSALPIFAG
jgi:hypothetical protein